MERQIRYFYTLIPIGLVVILVSLIFSPTVQGYNIVYNWRIDFETIVDDYSNDTCTIGEKRNASNNIDSYDFPKYPSQPPGRAFIFSYRTDFPDPYTSLWYEFRYAKSIFQIWTLKIFWFPWMSQSTDIHLQWNLSNSIYYDKLLLYHGSQYVDDLRDSSEYIYHVNHMQTDTFTLITKINTWRK